jgi:hypothetical protein
MIKTAGSAVLPAVICAIKLVPNVLNQELVQLHQADHNDNDGNEDQNVGEVSQKCTDFVVHGIALLGSFCSCYFLSNMRV